jgi:hypothetical protein
MNAEAGINDAFSPVLELVKKWGLTSVVVDENSIIECKNSFQFC